MDLLKGKRELFQGRWIRIPFAWKVAGEGWLISRVLGLF